MKWWVWPAVKQGTWPPLPKSSGGVFPFWWFSLMVLLKDPTITMNRNALVATGNTISRFRELVEKFTLGNLGWESNSLPNRDKFPIKESNQRLRYPSLQFPATTWSPLLDFTGLILNREIFFHFLLKWNWKPSSTYSTDLLQNTVLWQCLIYDREDTSNSHSLWNQIKLGHPSPEYFQFYLQDSLLSYVVHTYLIWWI